MLNARCQRPLWVGITLVAVLETGCASGPKGPDPERAKEMRMLGDEAYARHDYPRAVEHYTSAIEYNADYAEAYLKRGHTYTWLAEQPEENGREMRLKAVADYTVTIQLNPSSYDAYFNRALLAVSFKQYLAAVKDFLQCIQIRPGDPEAHFYVAELYETKFEDMKARAMEHYEQYVRLGGRDVRIIEMVKTWQAVKAEAEQPVSPPAKEPTPQEEEKAKELHQRMVDLIGASKAEEAWKVLNELMTKYAHTKYVQERAKTFDAMHRALKPREKK